MRYCSGKGSDLGNVSALPQTDFASLCAEVLEKPIRLYLTRAEFHALTPKERGLAKRVSYIVPATFKTSPAQRKYEFADKCNLVALDIDDSVQATRLLAPQALDCLSEFGFIVWHTASSTSELPRLRVLVHAEGIKTEEYRNAVRSVGELLGLTDVTTESMVSVQPMFLPTTFKDDEESPIVASNPDGTPFMAIDILKEEEMSTETPAVASTPDESVIGDVTHYRAPMEGITIEEASEALACLDPDMPMHQWIEMAAALKHQFQEAGYEIWDTWSAKGKKYVDSDETKYRWGTLKAQPLDRAPVTIRSLFKLAQAKGWSNKGLTKRTFDETVSWIKAASRSTEELLDNGARKIALASATLGTMERKSLMLTLRDAMKDKGMPIPVADIRQAVRAVEVETAKATGVPQWAQGLCFVTSQNVFYRHTTDRRFSPEVIDLMYGTLPVGDEKVLRPRDYLIQIAGVPQVENLRYDPARGDKRFFSESGVPYVNTYRPGFAKPEPERAEAAGAIFRKHISNLVAEEEHQQTLIDVLAYQVQHPGKKIRWATLLQGGMGIGKTALASAMTAVLGRRNVRKLSASNVMDSQYNDWAYGSQLVVMEEVRIIGHNRHGVMDKLKPCISDDEISLSKKYEDHRTVPNVTNYLMFTNHFDALAVNDGDRRYFVLSSPLQYKAQVEALGPEYFNDLFGMIRDNPGGLRAWFEQWTIGPKFDPEGRAPYTRYLKELAANSASPLAAAVTQTIEDQPHPLVRKDILSLTALRDHIDTTQANNFSDQALGAVLRELGWSKYDRIMLDGSRHQLWTHGIVLNPLQSARDRLEVL